MIRRKTIENRVAKIASLRQRAMDVEAQSEAQCGFVTGKAQGLIDKLNERSDKLQGEIVRRLTDEGLCTDPHGIGLTPEDADNEIFNGIEDLFEIGDGSWC